MKITVKKVTSPYNPSFIEIQLRASEDGPTLRLLLEALKAYKNQEDVEKAFNQNCVSCWAKIGTRFHPLGNIRKETYSKFLNQ